MHCQVCDCLLTEDELHKKDFAGDFMDICDTCEEETVPDDADEEVEAIRKKFHALFDEYEK